MTICDSHISADELFSSLAETLPDSIIIKDGNGHWLFINNATMELFHFQNLDWLGKTTALLAGSLDEFSLQFRAILGDDEDAWSCPETTEGEQCVIDASGHARIFSINKTPILNDQGDRKYLVTVIREITSIRQAERDLRIAEIAIDSLEAIVITDTSNTIQRVNRSFTRLTGYEPEEVIGKTTSILKSGKHDKSFYQAMWKCLRKDNVWEGEIWDRRKNGEIYPKWLKIAGVSGPDQKIHNYVGIFSDLSEHKEARDAFRKLALYDPLTDLPNRRMLREHLDHAIQDSVSSSQYGAVLMIDLDNFKLINDTMGHAVGDLLLIEVAKRFKYCVREDDLVARLGGDEFVIMLQKLSKDVNHAIVQAESVGEKILKVTSQPFWIAGKLLHSSLSIGISLFTIPESSSEVILKYADAAMYQAKAAGRNTLRLFDPAIHASLERRLSVESELRHAITRDELRLHYQIQVDSHSRLLGAEVLLRWENKHLGSIPIKEVISIAEESGLILPIGEWVLRTACNQLRLWERSNFADCITLAVNVSARQFVQPSFVDDLCKIISETGAKASHLKLELTESLLIQNISNIIEKMQTLKEMGIRFAIDDFGTGYSSLSYLKKLPIDELKIDRSFVRDIDVDPNDAAIAQTIIGMANILGFKVIAEGVETTSQLACLERQGCFAYQGYYFSRPLGIEQFEEVIREYIENGAYFSARNGGKSGSDKPRLNE